ncbi:hypothetical protein [Tenacibaculum maritimum]|uniref:hypothetical protein n=1 Tax=Tenacibaculum maritimum TaxID=107401 RepID=UPI0012E45EEE|nr:hypothetical protein [Tenacibaculum maritimum]MCD9581262.1 hypothetical protein [Tenacibaculum maritimum]MCD9635239.1 hypothetical protein [Tenacibaculum maritimum]CAA0260563.1 conserved hypothetical protein [Tenacibaculum maritimum]
MTEQVDFNKVINILNEELETKYASEDMIIPFPEFEYKQSHHYFTYSKDYQHNHLITFLKCHVYISGMYEPNENNEAKIIEISKEWFNNYMDTIIKLKF